MKLTYQKINRYLYYLIGVFFVMVIIITSNFLYANFYQVITQSEQIKFLRTKIVHDTIDIIRFNEIILKIQKKTTLINLSNINNPFL